jgi:hypothetical protein
VFVAKHFASRFCHRFFRQNFFGARVEATKSLTKEKRFFCGKTFCHKAKYPLSRFDEMFPRFATKFLPKQNRRIFIQIFVEISSNWS